MNTFDAFFERIHASMLHLIKGKLLHNALRIEIAGQWVVTLRVLWAVVLEVRKLVVILHV